MFTNRSRVRRKASSAWRDSGLGCSVMDHAEERWLRLTSEVAMLSSLWERVEVNLVFLFATVLRCEYQLASAILNTNSSNKIKREMIGNCARIAYQDETNVRLVEKLRARTAKGVRVRNVLAHSSFFVHPEHPKSLGAMSQSAGWQAYVVIRQQDLKRFRKQFEDLAGDLFNATNYLENAKRAELLDSKHLQRRAGPPES